MAPPKQPSVLLVRLGAVGDVIRTLPLLHAVRLRHPRTRIGWLVEEPSAPLLRELPALDTVHVLPRRALARRLRRPWSWRRGFGELVGLRRELREARYELVLDVHGTLKAALAARLAGGNRLEGFARGGSKEGAASLYDTCHPAPGPVSRIERALWLGRCAGLLTGDPPHVDHGLRFPAPRLRAARTALGPLRRPAVVLFPFASMTRKGRRKRWPLERHLALGCRLAERGRHVVLAWGSPAERDEARGALSRCGGGPAPVLAPPTDLVELSDLLRRCDLLVTGDTGPMHVAAAVGTPVLALFGPSDPVINRPWGEGHQVLVSDPLARLPVDEVLHAAEAMLERCRAAETAIP